MNTLKPLLLIAVLAAVGYGVYHRINSGPETPPPGVADGWARLQARIPGRELPMETRALGFASGLPSCASFQFPARINPR